MLARVCHKLLRHPRLILAATVLLTVALATIAQRGLLDEHGALIIDSSLESYISRGSDEFALFQRVREIFGNEQLVVVAVRPPPAERATLPTLLRLRRLARDIEAQVPGVARAYGITDAVRLDGACAGRSYFHRESMGAVCESLLEQYDAELQCLAAGAPAAPSAMGADPAEPSLASAPTAGLAQGLDEEPALLGAASQSVPAPRDLAGGLDEEPTLGGQTPPPGARAAAPPAPVPADALLCTADMFRRSASEARAEADHAIAAVMARLSADPLVNADLLSDDRGTYGLFVQFRDDAHPERPEVQAPLAELVAGAGAEGHRVAYAGQPRQQYEASATFRKDIVRILPMSVAIMVLVLALSFRNVRGVLIPLGIVLLGLSWTAGVFALAGQQLNPVLMVLPPLLICVGTAYVIFFMNAYAAAARESRDRTVIIAATVDGVALPLVVTALTTIAGFAALIASPIPAIKTMGVFACLGVAFIILLLLTLVPTLLMLLPPPKAAAARAPRASWLDAALAWISRLAGLRSRYFVYLWLAVAAFALLGLAQLRVDSDAVAFGANTPIMQDLRFIEEQLGGTASLRIVWHGGENGEQLLTAAAMQGVERLAGLVLRGNGDNGGTTELGANGAGANGARGPVAGVVVERLYSPLPFLRARYGDVSSLSDVEVRRFFDDPRVQAGARFFSDDGRWLQVTLRLRVSGSAAFLEFRDYLEGQRVEVAPGVLPRFTGGEVLVSRSADNIATGQARSILLALVIIFAIMSLLFFSPRMGLLALYPNVLTIAVFFGVLGWLDIPLGVTISVIGAIALGLGVDDTIHFLAHYSQNVKTLRNEREAAVQTVRQVGRPMVYTSVALTLGFLVFLASEMETQTLFGALLAFTLVVCLFTDLNFLPTIMANTKLITVWDYYGLKFTPEFVKSIPLFHGMSLRETKLATLMAYPVELAPGEVLFEEQSTGRELFVVLSGEVEIYFDARFHPAEQLLATLPTGAAFGEMGLFRQRERIASARAKSHTRLLAVTSDVLSSLQRRYPRIAAKLFLNLADTLAQRIHQSDEQFVDKVTPHSRIGSVLATVSAFLKQVAPTESDIRAAVDEIVRDGVVTIEERRALETKVYADGMVSRGERHELERLEQMIEDGTVREARDQFISMLERVSPSHIAWLKENFPTRRFEVGEELREVAAPPTHGMLILDGKVIVYQERNGELVPIRTVYRNELVGEDAILPPDGARRERVTAAEPTEVLCIDADGFARIIARRKVLAAQFAHNLVRMLSDWLQEANLRLYG